MLYYNKNNIPLAKALRKNMTKWEKKLWYDFLSKYPIRFQRQKAIGEYIADFYCAKSHLIVELDGEWHYDEPQEEKDLQRTAYFNSINIEVIRFTNKEVTKCFNWVCEYIDIVAKRRFQDN